MYIDMGFFFIYYFLNNEVLITFSMKKLIKEIKITFDPLVNLTLTGMVLSVVACSQMDILIEEEESLLF